MTSSSSTSQVLVVDDDAEIVSMLATMLSSLGYSVVESRRSADAVEILEDPDQLIDVLISDYQMDELSGDQVARCGFRMSPNLRFVLMSGNPEAQERVRRDDLFLEKPFDLDKVRRTMKRVDSEAWPRSFQDRRRGRDRRSGADRRRLVN